MSRSHKDVPEKKKRAPEKPLSVELWSAIQLVVRPCLPAGTAWSVGWSGPSGRTVRVRLGVPGPVSLCERVHRAAFSALDRLANMPEGWRLEVTSDPGT